MINGLVEDQKQNEIVVPRQFMEMGRAIITHEKDDISQSSNLEGRSRNRSGSPYQNDIVESMACKTTTTNCKDGSGRNNNGNEESPDQEYQGWVPNKVPKFTNPKEEDQNPETMPMVRKTRVSVRARSEASMVSIPHFIDPPGFQ